MNNDIERARFHDAQLSLFPEKPRDLCQDIQLNWLAALKLYQDGFLSFNPADEKNLNEAQKTELIFLGTLVAAGCDVSMLEQMIKNLQKPYQYIIDQLYYDWKTQEWWLFPHNREDIREQIAKKWLEDLDKGQFLFDWIDELEMKHVFEHWIDDLLNNGDIEQLLEIEESCSNAISRLREEE